MALQREGALRSHRGERADMEALRRADLFRELGEEDLAALAAAAQRRRYSQHQFVLEPESEEDGLVVVAQGSVCLIRLSERGREVTLDALGPGEVFGLPFIPPGVKSRSGLVAAVDGTVAYHIPRDYFRQLALDRPEVGLRALELAGRRLDALGDRVEDLALHGVEMRVRRELRRLAGADKDHAVRLTDAQLASRIGTRREEVGRAMSKLLKLELIERRGRGVILVPDPERLSPE